MPFYWADYFKDTLNFSTFQHGCYMLIIGAYWANQGPLLDDPEEIARICRTSRDKLARYGNPVLAKFYSNGTLLYHSRVEKEILRSCERISKASASANARWGAQRMLSTPTPTKEESNNNSFSNGNGIGKKSGSLGNVVTISDPNERLARFQKWLAERGGAGWISVSKASDPSHPEFAVELARCREKAKAAGKGWPRQWPSNNSA